MPLIKSGSKQAISTNIREMMHAGHPQDQSVAAALSTARKYGKKGTGGIVVGGKKVAPSIGGVMSKPPWKGYAEGGGIGDDYNTSLTPDQERAFQGWKAQRMPNDSGVDYDQRGAYLAGLQQQPNGHWEDQFKKPNHPTFSDQSQYAPYASHGNWAGDTFVPPAPMAEGGATDDIFNSADTGAMSPETFVNPLAKHMVAQSAMAAPNLVKNFVEGAQEYQPGDPDTAGKITGASGDLVMQGLQSALPVKTPVRSAGAPVFVGPYGATRLRNEALLEGKTPAAHPVVSEALKPELKYTSPKFRREAEAAQQDIMDEEALRTLQSRAAEGKHNDRDVFEKSGWSIGNEGIPRKEIPDIGAKLEKIPGTNKYELKHPAGDLHKIYDIPPIEFNPDMRPGTGYNKATDKGKTIAIVMGGKPEDAQMGSILHEIQHSIQQQEGFAGGWSMKRITGDEPHFHQEYFPGSGTKEIPFQTQANKATIKSKENDPKQLAEMTEDQLARAKAKFQAYTNTSGEVEAMNVEDRLKAGLKAYLKHPQDTEHIGRGLQWLNTETMARPRSQLSIPELKFKRGGKTMASGGMMPPPWFVRSEARGSSGMLKSAIPGRTDKIPLNVPGGSYVLPADIPSALGQGNTMAGGTILDKMFNRGPYGMNLPRAHAGSGRPQMARMSSLTKVRKSGYAEGGNTGNAKIIAAGGEYIIHAHAVADIGGGDMDKGHKILDAFVKHVRDHHIKTLKKLPGPKKN